MATSPLNSRDDLSTNPLPSQTPAPSTAPSPSTASSTAPAHGDGLLGRYYNDKHLIQLQLTRVDATIHYDWTQDPPPSLPNDTFSVRWTGFIIPLYSDIYTFYTVSDDGVRLWVDQKQVINQWVDQPRTQKKGTITLAAGKRYPIRIDYYVNRGEPFLSLLWSSPRQLKQVIPQSQLFST